MQFWLKLIDIRYQAENFSSCPRIYQINQPKYFILHKLHLYSIDINSVAFCWLKRPNWKRKWKKRSRKQKKRRGVAWWLKSWHVNVVYKKWAINMEPFRSLRTYSIQLSVKLNNLDIWTDVSLPLSQIKFQHIFNSIDLWSLSLLGELVGFIFLDHPFILVR